MLQDALTWLQANLGLQDWTITLVHQDDVPLWADPASSAEVISDATLKTATIWVSDTRAKAKDVSPIFCLFHECLHIAENDVGFPTPSSDAVEFLFDRLAAICELAYRR